MSNNIYHKKYIKYKTKYLNIQYGGIILRFEPIKYSVLKRNINRHNITKIFQLLDNYLLDSDPYLDYSYKIKDPFLESITTIPAGSFNLSNIEKWYEKYNPDYKKINEIGPLYIPEYLITLANMCICLSLLSTTNSFEHLRDDDRTYENNYDTYNLKLNDLEIVQLIVLLNKINDNIIIDEDALKISYFDFINITNDFLFLLSSRWRGINYKNSTQYNINEYMNSPFLLYPTYNLLDFHKIILLAKVPVLQFNIFNKITKIHSVYHLPLFTLFHDLFFHSSSTHCDSFKYIMGIKPSVFCHLPREYNYNSSAYKIYMENAQRFINKIFIQFDMFDGSYDCNKEEQFVREQFAREPQAREPPAREPLAREPLAREPLARELYILYKEPITEYDIPYKLFINDQAKWLPSDNLPHILYLRNTHPIVAKCQQRGCVAFFLFMIIHENTLPQFINFTPEGISNFDSDLRIIINHLETNYNSKLIHCMIICMSRN